MNHLVILFVSVAPAVLTSEWPVHPRDPINAANFARIQEGMTRKDVEKLLGSREAEASIGLIWQGRGRNAIIVGFKRSGHEERTTNLKLYFNPTPWQRIKEWWGSYELHPDGGRSKRLNGAA